MGAMDMITDALSGQYKGPENYGPNGGVNKSGPNFNQLRDERNRELAAKGLDENGKPLPKPKSKKKSNMDKMYGSGPSLRTSTPDTQ